MKLRFGAAKEEFATRGGLLGDPKAFVALQMKNKAFGLFDSYVPVDLVMVPQRGHGHRAAAATSAFTQG